MKRSENFKEEFDNSGYGYSDEYLFEMIKNLKNEIDTLKDRLENDGR